MLGLNPRTVATSTLAVRRSITIRLDLIHWKFKFFVHGKHTFWPFSSHQLVCQSILRLITFRSSWTYLHTYILIFDNQTSRLNKCSKQKRKKDFIHKIWHENCSKIWKNYKVCYCPGHTFLSVLSSDILWQGHINADKTHNNLVRVFLPRNLLCPYTFSLFVHVDANNALPVLLRW